jgi:hypothetical protein
VKPDELARCVSCGLLWKANVTSHECATMRLMTSHPRPLGARRTDIQVAFRVMFGILHFIAVKSRATITTLALSETVRLEVVSLLPLLVRLPNVLGGHVWGTKAKPLAPMLPTALLSKPRTRLR